MTENDKKIAYTIGVSYTKGIRYLSVYIFWNV